MSIIYNGTTIDNITYNGTTLDTVNYNNTEVFSGTKTLTVNIGDYIKNIIINGTTYTSNTTVNIKPGSSVLLSCNPRTGYTSNNYVTTSYFFEKWTGYTTTSASRSFTFTMPNENITYTANGKSSQRMSWPSEGEILEDTLLAALNSSASNKYDTSLVGRTVTLAERNMTRDWIIVRVNSNSYDLWYSTYPNSTGEGGWKGSGTGRYWTNNDATSTDYVRGECANYKSTLSSSIQAKLKTGLNANCGSDTVVILSYKQLGGTKSALNDDNSAIPYFNSDSRRSLGRPYWTSSAYSDNSDYLWSVVKGGTFTSTKYYSSFGMGIVPAIRVG